MLLSFRDYIFPRSGWKEKELKELFDLPLNDLMLIAHEVHRHNFPNNKLQCSTLLSIKSGSCPENCKYCSQSAHYNTGLEKSSELADLDTIKKAIENAIDIGADRFCFAAAWRGLSDKNTEYVCSIIRLIKESGLESCASLGMITLEQAKKLKDAGLDYYNHNLDTSREHYQNIVTTRSYDDRLSTLSIVEEAGINVCCGGILGIGESLDDRIRMILQLANLKKQPNSLPINILVPIHGTPIAENHEEVDPIDIVRLISLSRLVMPNTIIRLAAGRSKLTKEMHALCFFVGVNSIFIGDKLLTTPNNTRIEDASILQGII